MASLDELYGPNAAYVQELYERFRQNPGLVDPVSRAIFEKSPPPANGTEIAGQTNLRAVVAASNLAQAVRNHGHLAAHLDPLGAKPPGDPSLELSTYELSRNELASLPASLIGGPAAKQARNALDALESLRAIYCGSIGYEYGQIRAPEEREWLQQAAESRTFHPSADPAEALSLLERLTEVETFERFLQRVFPGKFRFSLEGLDMMVPMLDELIAAAAGAGIRNALLGMGHRGRLNVMATVMNKQFDQILAEFKDPIRSRHFRDDLGWTGDVKYHMGARLAVTDGRPGKLLVTLAPNPSHVEAINPIVEGMARAAGTRVDRPGPPEFDPTITLPILIHGDAAFAGQGIVAETLNLSCLSGYSTGGTIHLIANNQIGFTTDVASARSTLYASDLAKGFEIPVVHVNADDPEACVEAARLAFAYRHRFEKDFLIDLIGYRRRGHNEADEPSFTHAAMYRAIERHQTVREIWAGALLQRQILTNEQAENLVRTKTAEWQRVLDSLEPECVAVEAPPEPAPSGAARHAVTAISLERLHALSDVLLRAPQKFTLHPKLQRAMERRKKAIQDGVIEWSMAEELAFASILEEGVAIRLSGEDTERGTFSHRHAVFYDAENGRPFVPLQSLPQAKAAFEVLNSPLTENATLGFEYGYSIQKPQQLVLWEAQYGDFVNGAQVMVDEFIVSARAKWGQTPSLVLLLPHAYEGQGPNHSSARVERFLQLAVGFNMRITNPTTAAQYFHLLRRQAALLKADPLPLIVLTPKSLLRDPRVFSPLQEFAEGGWQAVIEETGEHPPGEIRHLILCSGKVFFDLSGAKERNTSRDTAIARIEQLYPYPSQELDAIFSKYPGLKSVTWVQEEPENMGAWRYLKPELSRSLQSRCPLFYAGRPPACSPAEGSASWHAKTQKTILEQAYHR